MAQFSAVNLLCTLKLNLNLVNFIKKYHNLIPNKLFISLAKFFKVLLSIRGPWWSSGLERRLFSRSHHSKGGPQVKSHARHLFFDK